MLHEILKEETELAIENAVKAMENCYIAMNKLSIETRVSFNFASTDLLDAWKFCQCWLEKIKKEKEG